MKNYETTHRSWVGAIFILPLLKLVWLASFEFAAGVREIGANLQWFWNAGDPWMEPLKVGLLTSFSMLVVVTCVGLWRRK